MWLVQLRNWIFILISLNPNSHMWLVTIILYSTASRKLWIEISSIKHILLNLLCHNSSVSVWNLEALFFFIQSAHSAIHFLHLIISYASVIYKYKHLLQEITNSWSAGTTSSSILYASMSILQYITYYKYWMLANNNDSPFSFQFWKYIMMAYFP